MTTGKALNGKPYAGNPHVRFDEGEVASAAMPRRGSLLYKHLGFTTVIAIGMLALTASAADYYVATTGDDSAAGTEEAPLATIDAAIAKATEATDVIHVAVGTYMTTTQYGPNLKAKLVGEGATRDDVIIQSAGSYRTLRMAAGSMVTNLTVIGNTASKADKGGAIEMNGGTLTDCVIKNGTAKNSSGSTEGGNLYVGATAAVVENCEIFGGSATKRGGNVYLDYGTVRTCKIHNGTSSNVGGNVFVYNGSLYDCEIYNGTSVNDGGNLRMLGSGGIYDSLVYDGTITTTSESKKGANIYVDNSGKVSGCHLKGGSNDHYDGGSLCVYSSSAVVENTIIEGSNCGGILMGGTSYLYNLTVVKNEKYGVWSWNATQYIYNSVFFGNTLDGAAKDWTGNQPTAAENFVNCALAKDVMSQSKYPTLVYVTEDDFTDWDNGDYTPVKNGALMDAGGSDPRGSAASTTDAAGNPRLSGTIDIGALEYQKLSLVVNITAAEYSQAWAPATVTFTHAALNSEAEATLVFTYDFGDGSVAESTGETTISHAYANPGVYTVKIAASNTACEETAEMTYENYIQVADSTVYVNPDNKKAAFPYNTPETGYASFRKAYFAANAGYTIKLLPGVHTAVEQTSISRAVTLIGVGDTPEDVIIRNTTTTPDTYYHRTLEVNNSDALVANLTIENGCVKNTYGGNLRVAYGMVSNCVIRGGLALADSGNAAGGAVDIGGNGAILTHCVISNNVTQGTSSDQNYAGGAIFIEYGARNAHLSNLLICGNRYVTSGDETKRGTAGIRFGGGNDWTMVENCTVVSNTVEGSLLDDSAAIYDTSWHTLLYNNIFAGNYETGKAKCTAAVLGTDGGSSYKYFNNITDNAIITGSDTKAVGNILVDDVASLFRNFASGNYTLKPGCKAQNAGTATVGWHVPAVDLAGNPRIFGKAIDIGCYECQKKSGFVITIR